MFKCVDCWGKSMWASVCYVGVTLFDRSWFCNNIQAMRASTKKMHIINLIFFSHNPCNLMRICYNTFVVSIIVRCHAILQTHSILAFTQLTAFPVVLYLS